MDITTTETVLIPVILALTELIKRLGLSSKFAPLVSLILGIGGVWLTTGFDLLGGIVIGLTASGLYSGGKTILK